MIQVKRGVIFKIFTPEIYNIFSVIDTLFTKYGDTCVITSANDGKHKVNSFHYTDYAIDLRSHDLSKENKVHILKELQYILGGDYDVLLENLGDINEHLHIEFDKKQ